jgi:hypothetical protein
MDAKERDEYRLGYFLWKGHTFGDQPNDEVQKKRDAAKKKFADLYEDLDDDLDGESLLKALDQLLGRGSLTDLSSENGRLMAVEILRDRMLEKTEQRKSLRGRLSGGIIDQFSDTGEVEDRAFARFESQYQLAKADGKIDFDEYSRLLALEGEYSGRHDEHVEAGDTVANVAATAAAIVVAIVVTAASGGSLGPAAAALVAQVGGPVVASGIGGALAKVTISAAVKGERYEGGDAAQDAVTGFVEGATAAAGANLSSGFLKLVGISQQALAAELTASIIRAGEVGVGQLGKQMAVGSLKAAIEGAIGGIAGEVVMTSMDAKVFQGKIFEVIEAYGLAILRGAATGAAAGALLGGPLEILAVYTGSKRLQSVIHELEALGYPKEKVTEGLARAVGAADAALAAKKPLDAVTAMKGSGLTDEEAEKIFRALAKSHGVTEAGEWPKSDAPPTSSSDAKTPVAEQIARLKTKYGDAHAFTEGRNGININGELDIHPDLLQRIPDADLDRIVDATKKLRAVDGDLAAIADKAERDAVKKTLDDFAKSGGPTGLRLRFRYQLNREVDAMLAEWGLANHFDELTPEQRSRLWDILNERPKQTPKRSSTRSLLKEQEKMGARWAADGTKDPIVFVDRFQHWNAVVDNEVKRLEDALDAAWAAAADPKEQMIAKWAEENLGRKGLATKKDAEDAIWESVLDSSKTNRDADQNWRLGEKRVAGQIGVHHGGAEVFELGDAELATAIRGAPDLRFGQESTAIYHPDKPGHWSGMPKAHQGVGSNHFEDYVMSANKTIKDPAGKATVKIGQDGSKTVIFEVTYAQPAPDGDSTMMAFVRVSREGDMTLATYMARAK